MGTKSGEKKSEKKTILLKVFIIYKYILYIKDFSIYYTAHKKLANLFANSIRSIYIYIQKIYMHLYIDVSSSRHIFFCFRYPLIVPCLPRKLKRPRYTNMDFCQIIKMHI